MDGSISTWLVIAVALAGANLPFLNEKLFGVIPLGRASAAQPAARDADITAVNSVVNSAINSADASAAGQGDAPDRPRRKSGWLRVLELLVLYFVVGAIAYVLEARIGNVFTQVKEFYMVTVPLFVVLTFPGFVHRYLRKQH